MQATPIPDVLVVGGGLVGAAAALGLARAGARVRLLDRGVPGREASQVAAGMLAPQAEVPEPGPLFDLAGECLQRFPAMLEALGRRSGAPPQVGFHRSGSVLLAFDGLEAEALRARGAAHRARGLEAREVPPSDLEGVSAHASRDAVLALHCPGDARVSSAALTASLLADALDAGVDVVHMSPVVAVSLRDGTAHGARLADGEVVAAGRVLLAAGAWSAGLTGIPLVPGAVEPERGIVAVLDWPLPPTAPVLYAAAAPRYVCPQPDGTVVVGATASRVGLRREAPAADVARVLAWARELAPASGERPFAGVRVGFRPASADGLPLLGPSRAVRGLHYATGHGRTGVLCGPPTALALAGTVLEDAPLPEWLRPFDASRLERGGAGPGRAAP